MASHLRQDVMDIWNNSSSVPQCVLVHNELRDKISVNCILGRCPKICGSKNLVQDVPAQLIIRQNTLALDDAGITHKLQQYTYALHYIGDCLANLPLPNVYVISDQSPCDGTILFYKCILLHDLSCKAFCTSVHHRLQRIHDRLARAWPLVCENIMGPISSHLDLAAPQ